MNRKAFIWFLLILCFANLPVGGQESSALWQKHTDAGQEAMKKRLYEEAEKQFQIALDAAESFGLQDQRLVRSIDNLARAYHIHQKYADAEALYRRALSLQEAINGPEHKSVASRLTDLATLYYAQPERRGEAEPLMIRALEIQEESIGPDSPEVSFTLVQLGYWHGLSGRDSEAEQLLLRALSIQQRRYGIDAPILNTVLTYLAAVRTRQQRFEESEALYKRVQRILEKALASKETERASGTKGVPTDETRTQNARDYAARLRNLTSFYTARQRYAEAEAEYQHALKVLEQEFGPEHLAVGMVLESYGGLMRRMNRVAEAEKMEARAKRIKEALASTSN